MRVCINDNTQTYESKQYTSPIRIHIGEMELIGDRIALRLTTKEWSEGELSRRSGVPQPTIHRIITGESKSPRHGNVELIAKALGVTAEWLFSGSGSENADKRHLLELDLEVAEESKSPSEKDYALIPQYTAKGSAGNGYHNDHVELKDGLVFKREWLKRMSLKEQNLSVIYADGSSMEPTIADGEVLLVDHSDNELKSGKVYALLRPNGDVSIKRLVQSFSGSWVIASDNTDKRVYPDEPLDEAVIHDSGIIGRIVWRGGGM